MEDGGVRRFEWRREMSIVDDTIEKNTHKVKERRRGELEEKG